MNAGNHGNGAQAEAQANEAEAAKLLPSTVTSDTVGLAMSTELAQAIKERREAMGLAQIKLGPVAGVSHGTIRNAEAGRPLEDETLRKIERALGWLPESTTPFMSQQSMAILGNLILKLLDSNESEGERARTLIHAFIQGVAAEALPREQLEETRALLAHYLPQFEVSTVIREAVKEDPSVNDELHSRAWEWARERGVGGMIMTTRMEIPREIMTADGRGYVFAVAPLPDDVMSELVSEDVEWLAETLRQHGTAIAHRIAEMKRRERTDQEASPQREEEGG